MANTEFFKNVANKKKSGIDMKDIFSDSFRKHSKSEFEFAITAGMRVGQTRSNMFESWRKPWLWFSFLKWSAILVVFIYALNFILAQMGISLLGLNMLNFILPGYIVTLSVMILLWELNVPRDISIFNMLVYFAAGGILSIFFTGIMLTADIAGALESATGIPGSTFAPIIEEPAKLLAGILLIQDARKKGKRITGLTGLLIGAGVGAGFTGIESMQYILQYTTTQEDAINLALRRATLLGGHILFCAPFLAMLCLRFNQYNTWRERLTDKGFLTAFAVGFAGHAVWNFFGNIIIGIVIEIPMILYLMYVIKECIRQTMHRNTLKSSSSSGVSFVQLQCIQGSLRGKQWQIPVKGSLVIGRDPGCNIIITDSAAGISRKHCVVDFANGKCIVKDLNSTNGTFIGTTRIRPGEVVKIFNGQVLILGRGKDAIKLKVQIVNC